MKTILWYILLVLLLDAMAAVAISWLPNHRHISWVSTVSRWFPHLKSWSIFYLLAVALVMVVMQYLV